MTTPRRATLRCLGLATLTVAACAAPRHSATLAGAPASAMTRGFGPEVQSGFAKVRAATAPFVSLDSAVAAGYARNVAVCYPDSINHHGAMGYHHVNRAYVDANVEVERPEILLYEKRDDGTYRLNGVEYIIPYRAWPRDSVPPILMGMNMKQEDNLKLWYMHMWIWTPNSMGLFADWNPSVKCPKA